MKEIDTLLLQVHFAFDRRSWHGTNLLGSMRGLKPDLAAWRPGKGRHNIWELIVHTAYWKYVVNRRITGAKRGSFPIKGSNFITRPVEKTQAALKQDIRLLQDCHETLLSTVSGLRPSDLDKTPRDSEFSLRGLIMGIAAHDLYHAGQIQLLKRLYSTGDSLQGST